MSRIRIQSTTVYIPPALVTRAKQYAKEQVLENGKPWSLSYLFQVALYRFLNAADNEAEHDCARENGCDNVNS